MQLVPGVVLAHRFEIVGPPLGAGASGVVYPVTDRATGRALAAKVLHEDRVGDPRALEQLQQEASTMGRLEHPRVLEVLGLWSDGDGRWVLVTERVEGVALSDLEHAMDPRAVVTLGLQLADALDLAHQRGIVHGDVRPGNILLAAEGCKLFDFGLASGDATLLRAGRTAPEVLDGGPAGIPADLYGLGVVMYRAMTGQDAFYGHTPWAIMNMQRQGRDPVPGPRGLARLVDALLHPDPVQRPQRARDVHRVLQQLQAAPDRRVAVRPHTWPAFGLGRAWVVHGIDPTTGGRAWMADDLSGPAARRLVARLQAAGWRVRADKRALSRSDLAWVVGLSVVGGVALPVVGAFMALFAALSWRSSTVKPALTVALPPCRVALPPRLVHSHVELALMACVLLMATAALMIAAPPFAVLPLLGVFLLARRSGRRPADEPDLADLARRGRVQAALADLQAGIDARELQLDESLGLRGEVEAIRTAFEDGTLDAESVLIRLDGLSATIRERPRLPDMSHSAMEALRRVRES
ncbi:MAG: serine/threonine-protein kinase [Myxococcota bacterium]